MPSAQKCVMIIEDEPDAAEIFAEMMRLSGYRVLKTYSGTPAMTLIRQEKPDAIILDLMLPGVSGLEVLHAMQADASVACTPVVIVSGRATAADIQAGLNAGAAIYLTKPVGYTDLKNAVDGLVKRT